MEYIDKATGNKYIEGEIFKNGGFCHVYKCSQYDTKDNLINDNLVLKRLIREDGVGVEPHRFSREMRYFEDLNHKHILKPIYVDELEGIIIMDKYPMNLADFISNQDYSNQTAFTIFKQIITAVEYYDSYGYLHRDLKPQNILLSDDNQIKITDFGLSSRTHGEDTIIQLTRTHAQGGTEGYSAPEQLLQLNSASITSEIYSLGKIFYALYAKHLFDFEMTKLSSLPSDISYFIRKATKYNPKERFQSIDELQKIFSLLNGNPYQAKETNKTNNTDAYQIIKDSFKIVDSTEKIQKIYRILNNEDFKELVQIYVKISVEEHKLLFEMDDESYYKFINLSCKQIGEMMFDFNYVDTIVNHSINLLKALPGDFDLEQQTTLINSTVMISASHNRFNSLRRIGKYISTIENPLLLNLLKNEASYDDLCKVKDYYNSENLDKLLIG